MALANYSLTYIQVQEIFNLNPFGIAAVARQIDPENPLDAFSFFVHCGLVDLRNPPICSCGRQKTLSVRKKYADSENQGLHWICDFEPGKSRCRVETSILTGTIFENTKLPWYRVLELCLHWFFRTPVTSAAGRTGVSNVTGVFWYNLFRDVCYQFVSNLDICIGGPGLTVEIDETHLFRRKYHRGRVLAHEDVWVFGGICRESGEAFIELVPDRTGPTLWPIIMRKIAAGTTIMSDGARVYNSLHDPNHGGYNHHQVNHRYNFVDPNNRSIHTNTIERQWGLLKGIVKGVVDDETIEMYLGEHIYRKMFLNAKTDAERRTLGKQFKQFLEHVKQIYPGPKY